MKRWAKRVGLGVFALVCLVLWVVVAALVLLNTEWGGRRILRDEVVARVNETLMGELTAERVRLRGGTLVLEGVTLRDPDGEVVAEVERLRASVALGQLLRRRVEIKEVVVERPGLYVVADAEGTNLQRALEPKEPKPEEPEEPKGELPVDIVLREARIEDGHLSFVSRTGAEPMEAEVTDLDVTASGSLLERGEKIDGRVQLGAMVKAPVEGPARFELSADGRGDVMKVTADGDVAGAKLKANATVESEAERLVATIENLELPAELARAFSEAYPLKVAVRGAGEVKREGPKVDADLTFRAGTAKVHAQAQADIERKWADSVEVRGERIDLAQLIEGGPKSDVSFELTGNGGGSSAENLVGEVRLHAPASKMGGETFGPVDLLAKADGGTYVLERLEAVVPGVALTARGRGDRERVQLFARLAAKDLSAFARTVGKFAGPEGLPLAGQGGLALRVEGPVEGPSVQLSGRFPFLRYDQNRLRDVRLSANVADARDPLAGDIGVDVRAGQATVGERVLQSPSMKVSLKSRQLALDASTRGSIRMALSGRGTVDEDVKGLQLSALSLRYPEASWALERPAAIRFEEELLLVDGLSLRAGEQRLAVTARRTDKRIDALVQVERLALSLLPKDLVTVTEPLGGTLNVDLTAEGAADDPALTVKGALADARYGDIQNVNVNVDAKWANDRATGELQSDALGAKARLDFDVPVKALQTGAPAPLSADLVLEEVSLSELARAMGEKPQAEGRLSARAKLRGTARLPKLDAVAEVRGLDAGEHPPLDVAFVVDGTDGEKLRARFTAKGDEEQPSVLTLQTPWTLARLIRRPPTAEQALRAPITLTGALHRLPVPYEDPSVGTTEPVRRFARLSGKVDVRGAALDPRGDVALTLDEFGAGELFPLTAALTLDLARARQLVTAKVTQGERQLLDATARLDAPVAKLRRPRALRNAPLALKLEAGPVTLPELQAFQPRPVVQPGEPVPAQLRGILHATLDAKGNLDAPVVEGGMSVHGLGAQEARGVGDLSVRFSHEGGRSRLAADLLSQGGELALRLAAPLGLSLAALERGIDPSKLPVHGSLRAKDFNPGFLSGVSPKLLEVGGRINAEADLTGHVGLPRVKGDLSWTDGVLSLLGQGRYSDIRVRVRGTDQAVTLEEAFARAGDGTARLTGELTRRGNEADVRAEAELKGFPVVSDFQKVATVSLRATAEGDASVEKILVSRLHIPEARIELPSNARRELHALAPPEGITYYWDGEPLDGEDGGAAAKTPKDLPGQRVQRGRADDENAKGTGGAAKEGEVADVTPGGEQPDGKAKANEPPDAEGSVLPRMEIHLDAPRNLWVRGDDMNVEVGFGEDFRVVMTDEPHLFGQVLVHRGRVDVFGRRFDLASDSTVTFTGPMTEPRLDVTATHENRREEVLVTLRVTGQGEDLQIQPSSEPPLTETEIYTLIATGRRSLQPGGRSASSGGGNAATSVLGSLATAQLQKGLRQVLPLDILSVEQGESGVGTARVEAGTYLTDRLYLGIASEIGAELERDENRNELLLEYQLWRRWVLELEYGDARQGGADLLWRKQY